MERLCGRQFALYFARGITLAVAVCAALLVPCIALLWAFWSRTLQIMLLSTVLSCEACFAIYYFYVIVKEFNKVPEQHAPPGYQPDEVVEQFLAHVSRVQDIQHFLSSWFLDAPFESIRLGNLKELYAYALWYKTMDEVEAAGLMPKLDDMLTRIQEIHDLDIPPGYNPDLRFMSHLWDEVPHIYRPLTFYLVMELIEIVCWAMLAANGFTKRSIQLNEACTVVYYTRGLSDQPQQQQQRRWWQRQRDQIVPQQQQQQQQELAQIPLVVLHGVGAGLLPYLGIVFSLAVTERPMICPVWKHVSMRLTKYISTVDDGAAVTLAALRRHGAQQAAFIAHSYGTCIAARLAKEHPEVVHTLALVDPVCFAMYMPNLVKFFLYSCHMSGSLLVDGMIALLSSEIHCARNFCRNFFWTSINLWDEHLPERTLVVLSGCDLLSPTLYVRDWLESHTKAKVMYNPTANHGAGLLLNMEWQRAVLQSVLQLVESPSSAAAVAVEPAPAAASLQGLEVSAGAAAGAAAPDAISSACRAEASTGLSKCPPESVGRTAEITATSSNSSAAQQPAPGHCDTSESAPDLGCIFDGDQFLDEFDAMFGNLWSLPEGLNAGNLLGLPEGLSSISSSAGNSLAEMFDAVDIDRLWDAAAHATNNLVAGVRNAVRVGSDSLYDAAAGYVANVSNATGYAGSGGNATVYQRKRGDVVGLGASWKGGFGGSSAHENPALIKCQ